MQSQCVGCCLKVTSKWNFNQINWYWMYVCARLCISSYCFRINTIHVLPDIKWLYACMHANQLFWSNQSTPCTHCHTFFGLLIYNIWKFIIKIFEGKQYAHTLHCKNEFCVLLQFQELNFENEPPSIVIFTSWYATDDRGGNGSTNSSSYDGGDAGNTV